METTEVVIAPAAVCRLLDLIALGGTLPLTPTLLCAVDASPLDVEVNLQPDGTKDDNAAWLGYVLARAHFVDEHCRHSMFPKYVWTFLTPSGQLRGRPPDNPAVRGSETCMLSRSIARCIAALVLAASLAVPSMAAALQTFASEREAQVHCPKDIVVWLNGPTMIWHYKGQRWYANTKHGAFACEKEAGAGGARGTRSGQ